MSWLQLVYLVLANLSFTHCFVRPGAGWYSDSIVAKASDPTPCVFTSVTPAW